MRLIASTLFYLLIKNTRPQSVYDIGSLDGSDALRFRQFLPKARIIAFEANPNHYEKMRENNMLKKEKIEVFHNAVSDRDGTLNFYVERVSDKKDDAWRQGISSLRKRLGDSLGAKIVKVPVVRLDTFVKEHDKLYQNLALWIDVEGSSFEVLKGIEGIMNKISVVHAEVEDVEIWQGQKLENDVENLMSKMGFVRLAKGFNDPQHDVVFINGLLWEKSSIKIRAIVLLSFIMTYLGFLIGVIPKVRPLISKIDIVRRL